MCSAHGSLQFVQSEPPLRLLKLMVISAGILGIGLTGCSQSSALTQATSRSNQESASPASPQSKRSAIADAEALVALGPRVAGTPVTERASRYIEAAFQQAGYLTEVQVFTYSKFVDHGSTLTAEQLSAGTGQALNGTILGNVTARLVAIPGVGRAEDFAQVDARGAIAIVQRGTIRFLEKANNAATAGAIGLVIVNNQDNNFLRYAGRRDVHSGSVAERRGRASAALQLNFGSRDANCKCSQRNYDRSQRHCLPGRRDAARCSARRSLRLGSRFSGRKR